MYFVADGRGLWKEAWKSGLDASSPTSFLLRGAFLFFFGTVQEAFLVGSESERKAFERAIKNKGGYHCFLEYMPGVTTMIYSKAKAKWKTDNERRKSRNRQRRQSQKTDNADKAKQTKRQQAAQRQTSKNPTNSPRPNSQPDSQRPTNRKYKKKKKTQRLKTPNPRSSLGLGCPCVPGSVSPTAG